RGNDLDPGLQLRPVEGAGLRRSTVPALSPSIGGDVVAACTGELGAEAVEHALRFEVPAGGRTSPLHEEGLVLRRGGLDREETLVALDPLGIGAQWRGELDAEGIVGRLVAGPGGPASERREQETEENSVCAALSPPNQGDADEAAPGRRASGLSPPNQGDADEAAQERRASGLRHGVTVAARPTR